MQLTLYTVNGCGDCREAKHFLAKHQIPYTEIDIDLRPAAAAELIAQVGRRAVPQFVVDGRWVQPYRPGRGFLYKEMEELFGLSSSTSNPESRS